MSELQSTASLSPAGLTPAMAERFDHPHPETAVAVLSPDECAEFVGLSLVEEIKFPGPTVTQGDIVGVVMLRRHYHDGKVVGLVAEDLPTFGLVVNINGHVGYLAKGLSLLDKTGLEMFSRKTLELVRATVIEGVRRDPKKSEDTHA